MTILFTYITLFALLAEHSLVHWYQQCITVHHVPKCMSCHKATVVIMGRAHCFHDFIYITVIFLLWDLSALCVLDHLWPLIYINIYIVRLLQLWNGLVLHCIFSVLIYTLFVVDQKSTYYSDEQILKAVYEFNSVFKLLRVLFVCSNIYFWLHHKQCASD